MCQHLVCATIPQTLGASTMNKSSMWKRLKSNKFYAEILVLKCPGTTRWERAKPVLARSLLECKGWSEEWGLGFRVSDSVSTQIWGPTLSSEPVTHFLHMKTKHAIALAQVALSTGVRHSVFDVHTKSSYIFSWTACKEYYNEAVRQKNHCTYARSARRTSG